MSSTEGVNPIFSRIDPSLVVLQPYWLIIIQILVLSLIRRAYNYWKHKTILTTIEIAFDYNNKHADLKQKLVQVDGLSAITTLIPLGHLIWYCIKIASCQSDKDTKYNPLGEENSAWQCYNLLGLQLFNYCLPSLLVGVISLWTQMFADRRALNCDKMAGLLIFLAGAGAVLFHVVFAITNAIPMIVAYIWAVLILAGFFGLGLLALMIYGCCIDRHDQYVEERYDRWVRIYLGTSFLLFVPLLVQISFNYSQYLYWGSGYLDTMQREYDSRDTKRFFEQLGESGSLSLHFILAFL